MKTTLTLFLLMFMFLMVPPATAQDQRACNWEIVVYCDSGGCIEVWAYRCPGSCPGDCTCPGREGSCGGGTFTDGAFQISQVQKQGLDILIAKQYVKKQVTLTAQDFGTPFPRILLAHGATAPPDPWDDGGGEQQCTNLPACSSCEWWNVYCLLVCIDSPKPCTSGF